KVSGDPDRRVWIGEATTPPPVVRKFPAVYTEYRVGNRWHKSVTFITAYPNSVPRQGDKPKPDTERVKVESFGSDGQYVELEATVARDGNVKIKPGGTCGEGFGFALELDKISQHEASDEELRNL